VIAMLDPDLPDDKRLPTSSAMRLAGLPEDRQFLLAHKSSIWFKGGMLPSW